MSKLAVHHLYVYYRVEPGHADRLRPLVAALQAHLAIRAGLVGALRRRPHPGTDGLQTWMEVYENISPEQEVVLQEALTHSGIPALISGVRHCETFIDL